MEAGELAVEALGDRRRPPGEPDALAAWRCPFCGEEWAATPEDIARSGDCPNGCLSRFVPSIDLARLIDGCGGRA